MILFAHNHCWFHFKKIKEYHALLISAGIRNLSPLSFLHNFLKRHLFIYSLRFSVFRVPLNRSLDYFFKEEMHTKITGNYLVTSISTERTSEPFQLQTLYILEWASFGFPHSVKIRLSMFLLTRYVLLSMDSLRRVSKTLISIPCMGPGMQLARSGYSLN